MVNLYYVEREDKRRWWQDWQLISVSNFVPFGELMKEKKGKLHQTNTFFFYFFLSSQYIQYVYVQYKKCLFGGEEALENK